MGSKSDLFFKAMAARKLKPSIGKYAEGGEVEEPEEQESDESISPEEKLAAYEILDAMGGPMGGPEGKSRAVRLAKALKSFFLIVDSQPHTEGGEVEPEVTGPFK
jgi:hypothetical protein